MVKLYCALIGVKVVFPVNIDENESMGDLKDVIKTKNPDDIKCSASKLELYLARKGDAWLSGNEPSAQQLKRGNVDDDIKSMLDCKPLRAIWPIQDYLNDNQMPAPQPNQIHVLVVLPNEVPLTISPNSDEARFVERYESLSKTLVRDEQVESLSKAIRAILEGNFDITPFDVLESSSGMGKTQMAFNLNATGEFDVFYIWCNRVPDKVQDISAAYSSRTDAFSFCLDKDFQNLKGRSDIGSITKLRGIENLCLYGFIQAALLGKNKVDETVKTRQDVKTALEDRAASEKKPFIVFLDEFSREIKREATCNGALRLVLFQYKSASHCFSCEWCLSLGDVHCTYRGRLLLIQVN
ncbi:uncharacterized protein CCR75_005768 [Bremia lactucae]|uniref:Crinkler effector protein N-terminal domain-containing protein n=1 Tax=Bremia lactucae TaxID=4779 RepID=A0A976FFG3_BRELC|nr:hypothetical protein CCR75_005768 [Bremia lactucae]